VSILLAAAAAVTLNAGQLETNAIDARVFAAKIAGEACTLASMAAMQHLDYRSHQVQLEVLRTEVNEFGAALGANPQGSLAGKAREVAALLSRTIEILNESQNAILPLAYRQTAKQLESAADQLLLEAKRLKLERD
jgi:hypothetical protein